MTARTAPRVATASSLWSALLPMAALAAGCAAELKLTKLEAAAHRPSNVAVFFAVDKADGEPVANLLANDFKIYEDGKLVSVDESQQTIVNTEIAAAHYTLLLVDLRASVTAVAGVTPKRCIPVSTFRCTSRILPLPASAAANESTSSGE